MKPVSQATIVYRDVDIASVELLLIAAILVALCLGIYALAPLWRWQKPRG